MEICEIFFLTGLVILSLASRFPRPLIMTQRYSIQINNKSRIYGGTIKRGRKKGKTLDSIFEGGTARRLGRVKRLKI